MIKNVYLHSLIILIKKTMTKKNLKGEAKKETLVAAGVGAVNALITKGASLENLSGKSKSAATRMKKQGLITISKKGAGKRTAKGKKAGGY